jgi:NADH-quinone oxidoreductase subunit K
MVPTNLYLVLAALLFTLGVIGVLTRRQAMIVLMSVELMLNGANLLFVTLARELLDVSGQVVVFFVMAVAAAEVAVGLAITMRLYDLKGTIDLDEVDLMKW